MTTGYPDDWDRRRTRVLERDHYQCIACGATGGPRGETELHVDHVDPKSSGGGHDLGNLQTLCRRCHSEKHGFEVGGDDEEDGDEEEIGGDDEGRGGPAGLGARLQRACRTTAASAALGVAQLLAAWTLAVATTTGPLGIATSVVAGLLVVGVTVGVDWRPGRLPGFAIGVAVPVLLLVLTDAVPPIELLSGAASSGWPVPEDPLRLLSNIIWNRKY